MINNMLKFVPIIACVIMFVCWLKTYNLLTEQFDYVKRKDEQFEAQKEKIKELEYKVDSTNAVLKNINANLYSISRSKLMKMK